MHVAFNCHSGGLWGHCGLQIASEINGDLKFELLDLDYLCCSVSLASKCHYFNPVGTLKLTPSPSDHLVMSHWLAWASLASKNSTRSCPWLTPRQFFHLPKVCQERRSYLKIFFVWIISFLASCWFSYENGSGHAWVCDICYLRHSPKQRYFCDANPWVHHSTQKMTLNLLQGPLL